MLCIVTFQYCILKPWLLIAVHWILTIPVCGHLHTFGCNKYGQLGVGDFKVHTGICKVTGVLVNHRVENVTCGDGFTVASTSGKITDILWNHIHVYISVFIENHTFEGIKM